jgi:general stress protein 26
MTSTDTTIDESSMSALRKLITDIKFAMLTTRNSDGSLVSRPMTTQAVTENDQDALWFFLSKSGGVVTDMTSDQHVGLTYADPDNDTYVSVSGRAVLVEDLHHKQALWSKINQAWFPNGPNDPDVGLLRVDIVRAHYWDVKKNKLMQLFDIAKASLSGTPPKNIGDSVEVAVARRR